jgi:glutathione S-transferase
MTEIILHHFDISAFAEKIRLALGRKRLAWSSVDIPLVMPKPDLVALTGGYRKTPVLQIGADIYCDTERIARELERRWPQPALFPQGSEGLCLALARWSDVAFFQAGAGLSMGTNEALPDDILADRRAFFSFLDFTTLQAQLPHFYAQFEAQLQLIEVMLADGRSFLLGEAPSWADILAYFPVWMCRANIRGANELLSVYPRLNAWEPAVAALGHGERGALAAEAALAVARSAQSGIPPRVRPSPWHDLRVGQQVTVTPDDYGAVPVMGELLVLDQRDIAIRREDARAGEVVVHFPRAGYRVEGVA